MFFALWYIDSKLHDDVPPMPARSVTEVLSKELNAPVEELFTSLNLTHPVGSASISQVQFMKSHAAPQD